MSVGNAEGNSSRVKPKRDPGAQGLYSAVLMLLFRFMYMTTIGMILYGICIIAVIAGAVLMNIAGNSPVANGGKKA